MSVSEQVKTLLAKRKVKQKSLIKVLDCETPQSVNNKFRLERWTAADLIKVANLCGARLAFILPGGERIFLTDSTPATPGGFEESVFRRG